MELNKSPSAKKSDHAPATTSAEQCSSLSQSWSRTYDCNFCKGGFSNARALGGHMNIHRKDKARLQKSRPVTESCMQQFLENTTALRAAVADNWTWNGYLEKNETASTRSDQSFLDKPVQHPLFDKTSKVGPDRHYSQNELLSSFSHGAELDLELRLGHKSASDS